MKNPTIHFILTGGTIDSFYDVTKDTVVPYRSSIIPSYVKSLKLYAKIVFSTVCMKDSRSITLKDRQAVTTAIEKTKHRLIIVTHGTYTMAQSAKYVANYLRRRDKTIVFIGSMIPLVGFSPSDAGFSLGFALAKVQELPAGIYVCMNGKVFVPEKVKKNTRKGRFES